MPKFKIPVDINVTVEADDETEAAELAKDPDKWLDIEVEWVNDWSVWPVEEEIQDDKAKDND